MLTVSGKAYNEIGPYSTWKTWNAMSTEDPSSFVHWFYRWLLMCILWYLHCEVHWCDVFKYRHFRDTFKTLSNFATRKCAVNMRSMQPRCVPLKEIYEVRASAIEAFWETCVHIWTALHIYLDNQLAHCAELWNKRQFVNLLWGKLWYEVPNDSCAFCVLLSCCVRPVWR